ncbi:MAG TPA: dTMP kinase [Candidatus Bipolaricaulota bacterium]
MFIVFEGLEKSGKSTQAKRLADHLGRAGRAVELVAEPGTTTLGMGIRELVLYKNIAIVPCAELLLYEAARAQVTAERIRPALQAGRIVVADRYTLSSIAYQGYGRGLELRRLRAVDRWATQGLRADLTLYFDIPLEEMGKRQGHAYQPDRLEQENLEFFHRVRSGYLRELRRVGGKRLDGLKPADALFEDVLALVNPLLDRA